MLQSLDDNKGIDIVSISLDGKSSIADFMVIASGGSSRQVAALAEHLEGKLKRAGVPILGKEGLSLADWVLLDTAEVIVHLLPQRLVFLQDVWFCCSGLGDGGQAR